MSKHRVEIHAVIEVDTEQWVQLDPDNFAPEDLITDATDVEGITYAARWLFPIEDSLPRWARDAVRIVDER